MGNKINCSKTVRADSMGYFYEHFGKIFENANGKRYYKAPFREVGAYKFIPAGSHFKGEKSNTN